jgi:hypothetical protein
MTADLLLPATFWGPPSHDFLAAIVEAIVLVPDVPEPTLALEANDFATAVTLMDLGISEISWQPLLPNLQPPQSNWLAMTKWAENTPALASPQITRHLDFDVTSHAQHFLRGLSLALLEQRLLSAARLARWVALADLSDQEDSLFQTALTHIRVLSIDSATLLQVAVAEVNRYKRRIRA